MCDFFPGFATSPGGERFRGGGFGNRFKNRAEIR